MRHVEVHKLSPADFTAEQIQQLEAWLAIEVDDAFAARTAWDEMLSNCLRMYEGVPKNPSRDFPVENAPNLEVTIGAIACDALFAQTIDTIFSLAPFLTVQPVPKKASDDEAVADAKAMQRFVNWIARNETDIRNAGEDGIIDTIQSGTGIYYIPWVERRKKARAFTLKAAHPVIKCIPPEDVIFLGGTSAGDLQTMRGVGVRFYYRLTELREEAKRSKWDLGEGDNRISQAGSKSPIRLVRENLARHSEGPAPRGQPFEILTIWAYFDIDDDGIDEDLMVVYDRTSKKVLRADYSPYDHRPMTAGVYQRRAHIPYGIGVLEMLGPYEDGISDFYNYWSLNALISNTKNFIAQAGAFPDGFKIWPMKVIEVDGDPKSVQTFDLGRLDASLPQALAATISLAERRVGLNEMNITRPSQVLGNRTPGITAISMLQQINRRFTPAFDSMRLALAGAIRQCIYRYQERVLAGNKKVMTHIAEVLGTEDGMRVVRLLRDQSFDEAVTLELTAVSATINKETERQNSLLLVQTLSQYYQQVMQLVMISSNVQVPNEVRQVASKSAKAAGELIERTIRTFDQVRDPEAFIIDIESELDAMVGLQQADLAALQGVNQLMASPMGQMMAGGQQQPQGPPGVPQQPQEQAPPEQPPQGNGGQQ